MLDDISRVKTIDRSNMRSFLQRTPEDLQEATNIPSTHIVRTTISRMPSKIVIAGVGGSSIGGDVISNWLSDSATVPIVVSRGLHLPGFADEDTLVIVVSYSGDTSETLGQFDEARERQCILYTVTSGGRLSRVSREHNIPIAQLKSGIPPRAAFPQIFGSLISILYKYEIIQDTEVVQSAVDELKRIRLEVDISKDTDQNSAKELALKLVGKFPVIYSLERMSGVARRFKNQLNENGKVYSKFDTIPEICHNEVESWPELKSDLWRSRCSFVFIRDHSQEDNETRIVRGIIDFLRKLGIDFSEIVGRGTNALARLLSAIYMGDYVSFYLAIAKGVDPTPIDEISRLKKSIWLRDSSLHESP